MKSGHIVLIFICFQIFESSIVFCQANEEITFEEKINNLETLVFESKYDQVLKLIDDVIADHPGNSQLYRIKGDAYNRYDDRFNLDSLRYSMALKMYNKSLELNKEYLESYYSRAQLHFTFQEFELALNDLSKCLKLNPNKHQLTKTLKQRTGVFIYSNRIEEAKKDFKKIIELNPESHNSYSNLGLLFLRTEEYNNAEHFIKRALEFVPNHETYNNNLGFLYIKQKKYVDAENLYTYMIANIGNSNGSVYSNRGYARIKLEKFQLALSDLNKAIELNPSNSYAYRNRAILFIEQSKFVKACKDIDSALALNYERIHGTDVIELKEKYCKK